MAYFVSNGSRALIALLLALMAAATRAAEGSAPDAGQLSPVRPYAVTEERAPCAEFSPQRRPFFGDTHIHTAWSFDASSQDTRNKPPQALSLIHI